MSCPSYHHILQLINLTMLFKVATKLQQICHKVTVVQLEGYITLKISSIVRISFLQNLSSLCDVYNWS